MTEHKQGGFITGWLKTPAGNIPKITTQWDISDWLGAIKVRFMINRTNYKIQPGLYAVGDPVPESVVLVSANYKLSFDSLRKELQGINAWILVLDTKGINVWCAAGKGTFGTQELVQRIASVQLEKVVKHKKLVLPQLGAVGVAAHEVAKLSGFSVRYGPVRASDLPEFLHAGMKATTEMRKVTFTFLDRLLLTPGELVISGKYMIVAVAVFFLVSGLNKNGYSSHLAVSKGFTAARNLLAAYLAGNFFTPLLLPWIPGRRFSFKGLLFGILVVIIGVIPGYARMSTIETIAWMLIIPAISSFLAMNFTGSSTYTSLSGVRKEMQVAVPLQLGAAVIGLILWIIARFI